MRNSIFALIIVLVSNYITYSQNSINAVIWAKKQETKVSAWVIHNLLAEEVNGTALLGYHLEVKDNFWIEPLVGVVLETENIKETVGFKSYFSRFNLVQIWLEAGIAEYVTRLDDWNIFSMIHTPVGKLGKIGYEAAITKKGIVHGLHAIVSLTDELSLVVHYQEQGKVNLDVFISL